MEVEPISYLEQALKEAGDRDEKAAQALALAADAVRLHVASTGILSGLVAMVASQNRAFADELSREITAMNRRIESIAKALDHLGKP